ncbi:hypothetical protein [Serratia nevei]|uniref:hypothetical protein n=1 Tax=Serratia nevei TaxID=2703794 RepID=UPI003362683F
MTLTTTEELKHLASSDNANELTRRLARECLANREARTVQVTDGMALDFHHALTDGSIGNDELEEIKVGLRAALCNVTAPPAPAVPEEIITAPIDAMRCGPAASYVLGWNACRAAMLAAAPEGGNDHDTRR